MANKGIDNCFKLLSKDLQKLVKGRFKEPTKIQKLAIPVILSKKNALVIAPTGIGKTESCILPGFDLWLREKPKPISILYISPLKSLNRDLLRRFLWWGNKLEMDISVRHGDTSKYARKMQAEVPPDCLITTPETLQAILPGKRMKEHLRNVKWVIVDEIHDLVTSKRGIQLTIALERLRELCGDFQLISLSATVGSPKEVANFISGGRAMQVIKAQESKDMELKVINPKPKKSDSKLAEQIFSSIGIASRVRKIHELVKNHTSTLTFTNTRDFAEVLASRLKRAYPNSRIENHHSSLSKEVRIKVEEDFKSQKLKGIVCTSSLELGIDVGSIDYVVQFLSPRQTSRAIQRVGRSGHELGRVSDGVIISTGIDDVFEAAIIARQALAEELEPLRIHENALDVLAHQIVGVTREKYEINSDELYEFIKRAYPYRNLTRKDFMAVCQHLNMMRYASLRDGMIKSLRKGLFYYFENLSTIPDTKNYLVVNSITNERVGSLDEEFIALHGAEGGYFIIKGEPWRIVSIEKSKIFAEPSSDVEAAIPGWEGELIPVPREVAEEVGFLRGEISRKIEEGLKEKDVRDFIKARYPIDDESAKKMIKVIKEQRKYGVIPTNERILIENHGENVIIHSCLGTLANETLGRFLSSTLSSKLGSVGLETDPYRITLKLQKMDLKSIKEILFKTKLEDLEPTLDSNLSNSKLFQYKFVHVAKRFGVIRKDAEYGKVAMKRIMGVYVGTPVWKETLKEIKTEKLDLEGTKEILERIQRGEIKIIFKKGLSPLGKIKLRKEPLELIGPGKPEIQILDIFKKRLMNKKIRLVCLNCGEWSQTRFIKDLKDEIRCRKCRAKLVGITYPRRIGHQKIVKKKLRGLDLTVEEERRLDNLSKTSDLVIVYGKKAAIALATRGVGPRTATRILRGMYETDEDFYKALLKAERNYMRTKKYWG